jgi:hypothetical protein
MRKNEKGETGQGLANRGAGILPAAKLENFTPQNNAKTNE